MTAQDRSATEGALAAIWAEVLRRDTVGRDEDFFSLGGNSLLAVRMIGMVHERMGCEVPIQRLLASRTVAELAEALTEIPSADAGAQEEGVI